MMAPPQSRGPGRVPGRRSFTRTIIIVAILLVAVGGLIYQQLLSRNRMHKLIASQAGGLEGTRARLLADIEQFNKEALSSGHPQIAAGDGVITKSTLVAAQSMAATAITTPVNKCAGEKQPADKRYQMRPAAEVAAENPDLAAKLKKHSINNEIMLALANGIMICQNTTLCWWKGGNVLETFIEILQYNNVTNHLIGVLDDETEAYLKGRKGVNWFRVNIPIPESQKNTHPANRVSTIKYTLLMDLIQMGYDTLITDMDLVYMKNPFKHLHRDADIEVQTDGFDDMSYGVVDSIRDPTMGWGGGGLYIKLFTTNVGCMWVAANQRTYTLMKQVHDHLKAKSGWDQQVFNQYLLQPSHGDDFANAGCSLRVMDYMKWMNSKIFFRSRRSEFIPGATSKAEPPILVHFNYHPDKHVRMLCIVDRFHKGKLDACDHFPGGSEKGT